MTAVKKAKRRQDILQAKIERIRAGKPVRTLDLFAGCGGLSLGFQAAGFTISGAIEIDAIAARTHGRNFSQKEEGIHAQSVDIAATNPANFAAQVGLGRKVAECIDVIVGGPPCQAFARVGRAKLREIDAHPTAFKHDARGNLYLRFLHYAREFEPVALLIENVPDMMNYGGHNVAEEVSETLEGLGYVARYSLLNSAFYGVPQMRERMYLVAYRRELEADVNFPAPRNHLELPVGYKGSRDVALKALRNRAGHRKLFHVDDTHYIPAPKPNDSLPAAVTAEEALGDLPQITLHLEGKLRKSAQRLDMPHNTRLMHERRLADADSAFTSHGSLRYGSMSVL